MLILLGVAFPIFLLIIVYVIFFFTYAFKQDNLNSEERKYYKILIINFIIILFSILFAIFYINFVPVNCSGSNSLMYNTQQIEAFNRQFEDFKGTKKRKRCNSFNEEIKR